MKRHRLIILPAFLLVVAACSTQPPDPKQSAAGSHAVAHGAPAADARPVLYDSLGSYSYRITTASPAAQR